MAHSGLNHWGEAGRPRDLDEVYIPIPKAFYDYYGNPFPPRGVSFFFSTT